MMKPRRALRSPLLHFLCIGGLLFALNLSGIAQKPQAIEISAGQRERLRTEWMRETGREPSAAELRVSLRRHADQEMLLREALRLGLDRRDPVVRERLLLSHAFLWPDARLPPEQVLAQARQLGMVERDLVARRRLVQLMEARLASTDAARSDEPQILVTDSGAKELRAFTQVWIDPARAAAMSRVSALHAGLISGQDARGQGDAFLLGHAFAPMSESEIARRFGGGFASALMRAPQGQWIGPLHSVYGLHLVRVETIERQPEDRVSGQRRDAYQARARRDAQRLDAGLARLRERYPLAAGGTAS